jgi:hypothetical protein
MSVRGKVRGALRAGLEEIDEWMREIVEWYSVASSIMRTTSG